MAKPLELYLTKSKKGIAQKQSLVHPKGGMSAAKRLFFFHATEKKGAAKVTKAVKNWPPRPYKQSNN